MEATKDKVESLSPEELKAANERYEREKAERTKGTSVEGNDEIAQLTPEMQRALKNSVVEGVKYLWEREVEMRQKYLGETRGDANSFMDSAVSKAFKQKERQRKEDEICATFLCGAHMKDRQLVNRAFDMEQEYLGRDTNRMKEAEETRAMGGATAGDELVPEVFETRVIDNVERLGLVRQKAFIVPMSTDTVKVPKISAGLTAYEVAAGAQITASDLTTAQLTLGARKLATITALHNELILNANPTVIPILIEHAAVALASKEDSLALTGSGSTVSGVLESSTNNLYNGGSSTSGNTAISDVDFDDAARLIDGLDSQYIDNGAAFYFNKKATFHLSLITISNTYAWAPAAAGQPAQIRGFDYYTSSQMPAAPSTDTAYAFFGNLNHLYMGDRQRMTVFVGREGTVGSDNILEKDMSAVRVTEHVEFEISDDEGFAILKTAAS